MQRSEWYCCGTGTACATQLVLLVQRSECYCHWRALALIIGPPTVPPACFSASPPPTHPSNQTASSPSPSLHFFCKSQSDQLYFPRHVDIQIGGPPASHRFIKQPPPAFSKHCPLSMNDLYPKKRISLMSCLEVPAVF